MQNSTRNAIQKMTVARRFSRAAKSYDHAAVLQHEIGRRLIERLETIEIDPKIIADIGCGTGKTTRSLKNHFPAAKILNLDIALGMLEYASTLSSPGNHQMENQNFICADAEKLPLAESSVDFIFSNCTFQWCFDLKSLFEGLHRTLKPDGLLLFSTFGPDTLKELRACQQYFDTSDQLGHHFPDMHDLGDLLVHHGFREPVVDSEILTLHYKELQDLHQDLKDMGANYQPREVAGGLSKKFSLLQLAEIYEKFRTMDDHLPATFEVIYGYALGKKTRFQNSLSFDSEVSGEQCSIPIPPVTYKS